MVGAQRVVRSSPEADPAVGGADLLENQNVLDIAEPGPAVLFRYQDAEQAEFAELAEELAWEVLLAIPLHRVGRDLVARQIANHVSDGKLII